VTPVHFYRMCGALDPTGAICGPYGEGVGTGVCVGPWLLQPGGGKIKNKEIQRFFVMCLLRIVRSSFNWEKMVEIGNRLSPSRVRPACVCAVGRVLKRVLIRLKVLLILDALISGEPNTQKYIKITHFCIKKTMCFTLHTKFVAS